jgi:nicotinamide mononucleotide transporter
MDLWALLAATPAIEWVAATLGVACVYLLIRQSLWSWPVGILMTSLYAWIFLEVRLYSDFGLQLFFIALQAYGWWFWLARRDKAVAASKAPIQRLSNRARIVWLIAGLVAAAALGTVMDRYTDAALPYWDALTTSFSVVAQILLARKYIENWAVWIGVDVFAVGIYFYKDLTVTSGLYLVFLGMAIWGLLTWLGDPDFRRAQKKIMTGKRDVLT